MVLCLMENTVQLKQPELLRYKFDLKGSTHGRFTKGIITSKTDRKDLDFVELKAKDPDKLSFAEINKHLIMILKRDIFYLKSRGLIDYSLLLAVELSTEKFKPKELVEQRIICDVAQRRHSMNLVGREQNHFKLNKKMAHMSQNLLNKNLTNNLCNRLSKARKSIALIKTLRKSQTLGESVINGRDLYKDKSMDAVMETDANDEEDDSDVYNLLGQSFKQKRKDIKTK